MIDTDALRRVAEAADDGGRRWDWKGGYPQHILRLGDATLIGECFTGPDHPAVFAEHIATFDPPKVIELLNEIDGLRAALKVAME